MKTDEFRHDLLVCVDLWLSQVFPNKILGLPLFELAKYVLKFLGK